jgi:putative IMPACT (imprinted ancient) family translation regulator
MEHIDYLTIKKPSEGLFRERGSKFLAFAFPVSSEEEIQVGQFYREAKGN